MLHLFVGWVELMESRLFAAKIVGLTVYDPDHRELTQPTGHLP
jgi:hypothetical protein